MKIACSTTFLCVLFSFTRGGPEKSEFYDQRDNSYLYSYISKNFHKSGGDRRVPNKNNRKIVSFNLKYSKFFERRLERNTLKKKARIDGDLFRKFSTYLPVIALKTRNAVFNDTAYRIRNNEDPTPDLTPRQPQQRIVGGTPSDRRNYSYTVYFLNINRNFVCGGSLIAPNIVLTAAHCFVGKVVQKRPWTVIIGKYNISIPSEDFQEFQISEYIIHPKNEPKSFAYDFAIVQLEGYVVGIKPVKIDDGSTVLNEGDILSIVGWGLTEPEGSTSDILLEGKVEYISNDECRLSWRNKIDVIDAMMCGISATQIICNGDSGGPLLSKERGRDIQVGISSFVRVGCKQEIASVYARISSVKSWIDSFIPSSEPSSHPFVTVTQLPTFLPGFIPSIVPTSFPNVPLSGPFKPTSLPNFSPSIVTTPLSSVPLSRPSSYPTTAPTQFDVKTVQPSILPRFSPSKTITSLPTNYISTLQTSRPSLSQSKFLTPYHQPSYKPSYLKLSTPVLSLFPSTDKSKTPSHYPSDSVVESSKPSVHPSKSSNPSNNQSLSPSYVQSAKPSLSSSPSRYPILDSSNSPLPKASDRPSKLPSSHLPNSPRIESQYPSLFPSIKQIFEHYPSKLIIEANTPSARPSKSMKPSNNQSLSPSYFLLSPRPSLSSKPSSYPSLILRKSSSKPSKNPSGRPLNSVEIEPSRFPSIFQSMKPTFEPSPVLTLKPLKLPTMRPPSFSFSFSYTYNKFIFLGDTDFDLHFPISQTEKKNIRTNTVMKNSSSDHFLTSTSKNDKRRQRKVTLK